MLHWFNMKKDSFISLIISVSGVKSYLHLVEFVEGCFLGTETVENTSYVIFKNIIFSKCHIPDGFSYQFLLILCCLLETSKLNFPTC